MPHTGVPRVPSRPIRASRAAPRPSGSGKFLVSARSGLPVLRLDDCYKEGDYPTLPLVAGTSDIDWDDPASWDANTAVDVIERLCRRARRRSRCTTSR
ncbi:hypothetical protein SALBM217S_01473 [Streptomyces griseoloalbus]